MNEFVPSEFYLAQNYPNPFKEKTIIKYCIAYKTRVKLTVYNSEGEEIEILVDEEMKAGSYEIEYNIVEMHRDTSLQSGTYYYRLEAGDYRSKKKMELEK
jgi:hypothetical protein